MKKYSLFKLIFLVFLIAGCTPDPKTDSSEKKETPAIEYDWENFPLLQTVTYPLYGNKPCLNYDLDSLANGLSPHLLTGRTILVDLFNKRPLLFFFFESLDLKVEKVDSSTYILWGIGFISNPKNWKEYDSYKIIKYDLQIQDSTYTFGIDKSFVPDLEFNIKRLEQLITITQKDTICHSENQDIYMPCADLVHELECYLFNAILHKRTRFIANYTRIRNDFPLININAAWAEDLMSKERILMNYGYLESEPDLKEYIQSRLLSAMEEKECD